MTTGRRRAATYQLLSAYATTLLNILNGLVLVPVYFHYFALPTYGSWLACQNVVTWLGIFELGFNLVFAQRLVQDSTTPAHFAETVGAGMIITLSSGLTVILAGASLATGGAWW